MSARVVPIGPEGVTVISVNAQKTSLFVPFASALAGHSFTVWGDNGIWDNTATGPVAAEAGSFTGIAGSAW